MPLCSSLERSLFICWQGLLTFSPFGLYSSSSSSTLSFREKKKKKTFAASGGDVSFPGCYGDEKADYKAPIGRGKQPLDSREPLAQPEVTVEQKGQVWGQWGRWRWGGMEVSQAGGPGGVDSSEGSQELRVAGWPLCLPSACLQ